MLSVWLGGAVDVLGSLAGGRRDPTHAPSRDMCTCLLWLVRALDPWTGSTAPIVSSSSLSLSLSSSSSSSSSSSLLGWGQPAASSYRDVTDAAQRLTPAVRTKLVQVFVGSTTSAENTYDANTHLHTYSSHDGRLDQGYPYPSRWLGTTEGVGGIGWRLFAALLQVPVGSGWTNNYHHNHSNIKNDDDNDYSSYDDDDDNDGDVVGLHAALVALPSSVAQILVRAGFEVVSGSQKRNTRPTRRVDGDWTAAVAVAGSAYGLCLQRGCTGPTLVPRGDRDQDQDRDLDRKGGVVSEGVGVPLWEVVRALAGSLSRDAGGDGGGGGGGRGGRGGGGGVRSVSAIQAVVAWGLPRALLLQRRTNHTQDKTLTTTNPGCTGRSGGGDGDGERDPIDVLIPVDDHHRHDGVAEMMDACRWFVDRLVQMDEKDPSVPQARVSTILAWHLGQVLTHAEPRVVERFIDPMAALLLVPCRSHRTTSTTSTSSSSSSSSTSTDISAHGARVTMLAVMDAWMGNGAQGDACRALWNRMLAHLRVGGEGRSPSTASTASSLKAQARENGGPKVTRSMTGVPTPHARCDGDLLDQASSANATRRRFAHGALIRVAQALLVLAPALRGTTAYAHPNPDPKPPNPANPVNPNGLDVDLDEKKNRGTEHEASASTSASLVSEALDTLDTVLLSKLPGTARGLFERVLMQLLSWCPTPVTRAWLLPRLRDMSTTHEALTSYVMIAGDRILSSTFTLENDDDDDHDHDHDHHYHHDTKADADNADSHVYAGANVDAEGFGVDPSLRRDLFEGLIPWTMSHHHGLRCISHLVTARCLAVADPGPDTDPWRRRGQPDTFDGGGGMNNNNLYAHLAAFFAHHDEAKRLTAAFTTVAQLGRQPPPSGQGSESRSRARARSVWGSGPVVPLREIVGGVGMEAAPVSFLEHVQAFLSSQRQIRMQATTTTAAAPPSPEGRAGVSDVADGAKGASWSSLRSTSSSTSTSKSKSTPPGGAITIQHKGQRHSHAHTMTMGQTMTRLVPYLNDENDNDDDDEGSVVAYGPSGESTGRRAGGRGVVERVEKEMVEGLGRSLVVVASLLDKPVNVAGLARSLEALLGGGGGGGGGGASGGTRGAQSPRRGNILHDDDRGRRTAVRS